MWFWERKETRYYIGDRIQETGNKRRMMFFKAHSKSPILGGKGEVTEEGDSLTSDVTCLGTAFVAGVQQDQEELLGLGELAQQW